MKLNLKNSLLASSLVLLSLSGCASSTGLTSTLELSVPSISETKTTGHTAEILKSAKKVFHVADLMQQMDKYSIDDMKITFDENNYNPTTDSFDISNVKVVDKKDKGVVYMERMIKDSNKSVQMLAIKFINDSGYGHKKPIKVKKIIVLGDMVNQTAKNVDIAVSAQGLFVPKMEGDVSNVGIDSVNFTAKVNDQGIHKLNLNVQGLLLDEVLANKTKNFIQSFVGSYAFYKTNSDVNDSQYTVSMTDALGYDKNDKSKISYLSGMINLQLDNNVIHSMILDSQNAKHHSYETRRNTREINETTKLVSAKVDFKNNGLTNAFYKSFPEFKSRFSIAMKPMFKMGLKRANLVKDSEIDNFVDTIFNVSEKGKNLTLHLNTISPTTFKDIKRSMARGRKILDLKATN